MKLPALERTEEITTRLASNTRIAPASSSVSSAVLICSMLVGRWSVSKTNPLAIPQGPAATVNHGYVHHTLLDPTPLLMYAAGRNGM